jgi:hypothetical protein
MPYPKDAFGVSASLELYSLAYVSQARRPITEGELDQIVVAASGFNATQMVTGVLLHDGSTFLQFLEGPESGIERVYDRIKASSKHTILAELTRGRARRRHFERWNMASRQAKRDTLLAISSARWDRLVATMSKDQMEPDGIRALLQFWDAGSGGSGGMPGLYEPA